jgi:GNAT superfamily N-acetyltransferase
MTEQPHLPLEILRITQKNIQYLEKFINLINGQQHFRYFNKRDVSCLRNHFVTLIGCINNEPVAYGHIDHDQDKYWLGISVIDQYHGRGYGRHIMRELVECFYNSQIDTLYLTVDKDNVIAFNLYKKFGFVIYQSHEYYHEMTLSNQRSFNLRVSCGEALDKLSILEIKLDKITDDRVTDVRNEYDLLAPILIPAITKNKCEFLYSLLKKVNLSIWEKQDLFRYADPTDTVFRTKLCTQIIEENDQRFRIKNKINYRLNSLIKEQKGYKISKALVIPHMLMGDQILMIPAVRYLSIIYDEVHLWAIHKTVNQLRCFYADDPNIKVIECTDNWWCDPSFYVTNGIDQYEKKNIFSCGIHKKYVEGGNHDPCVMVPYCFYTNFRLTPDIFWNYFHIAETQHSFELPKLLPEKYIFIHTQTGQGPVFNVSDVELRTGLSKDEILYIDPNTNPYPTGHKFYELAEKLVGHNINDYTYVLINADQIYISDSCFFCLAMHLGIKTYICYVKARLNRYDYLWAEMFGFNVVQKGFGSEESRKIFVQV